MKRFLSSAAAFLFAAILVCGNAYPVSAQEKDEVTIRISSWEEYIDLGDWDEVIDLESGDIYGENPMIDDFEQWYEETYGIKVNVEYSTFGTNEDLYNMLTLGDVFDLVCPSEYMIMKLMVENRLQPLSDEFFDEDIEENYYTKGVSPFIQDIFEQGEINGESWSQYAAGYMWGVTGIVYNPEEMTEEEASSWKVLADEKFRRRITTKDNVRDSYFVGVAAVKSDLLTSEEFRNAPDYRQRLEEEMNDVSPETIAAVEDYLRQVSNNVYSFETELGKADMMTGKIAANYQWSGDGTYTMDQADEDDFLLYFAVPEEATNIYFDGWVMLKNGIEEDSLKQHACEAFINFISRPDNVIRNMYYVGYTSVIAGGDDERIFEYADWNYGAEEDDEDALEYPLGLFFTGDDEDEDYILSVPADSMKRQISSMYPPADVLERSSIMTYFDDETTKIINRMWINIRCFDIRDVPVWGWLLIAAAAAAAVIAAVRKRLS